MKTTIRALALLFVCVLIVVLSATPRTKAQDSNAPGAAAAPPAAPAQPQGRKKRVAVFDFDYATVQTNSSAVFGTNVDVGKGISDLLVKYLV
ncbi:MAG: hypothetical protein ACRD4X_05490, partial [Candidatus Acidiferrales bacterium]